MAKLTRKQYTRKHLFMGAVILVAVVLVVTGVAIWLLLGSLSQSVGGSLSVSPITDSLMSFSELYVGDEKLDFSSEQGKTIEDVFVFDSAQNDHKGRLTCDGKSWEKRIVTVRGKLSYADYLKQLYYTLELPDGVIAAAKEGYLNIDAFYDENWETKKVDVIVSDDNVLKDTSGREVHKNLGSDGIYYLDFEFVVEIKWGEKFGGKNPSVYYDEKDGGADVPDDEVKETLTHFAELVNGKYNENNKLFTLTVNATPNNQ